MAFKPTKYKLPPIPIRSHVTGDIEKGTALIPYGKTLLAIMREDNESNLYSNISKENQIRTFWLAGGITITTSVGYGLSFIDIYVPILGGGKELVKKEKCICNCNFTTGIISKIQDDTIDGAPLYNVLACFEKQKYVLYENVLASDWSEYSQGEKVILIAYNDFAYTCCIEETSPTGCNPTESELETSDDDWRSTVRIIPWCGFTIPFKEEYYE